MSLLFGLLLPQIHKDDGDQWITVNGQHILIGADGNPKSGNVGTRIGMRISNEKENRDQLDKSYREFEKAQRPQDVPANRAQALQQYAGSQYGKINKDLRDGKESDCTQCRSIDKALDASSIPHDTEVFRGGSFSEEQASSFTVGAKFSDKAYVSTSMSTNTAKAFTGDQGHPVMFSIQVPKGSKGLAMGSFSNHSEYEILLPRGSQFEVVSVSSGSHNGQAFKAVELKYLGAH